MCIFYPSLSCGPGSPPQASPVSLSNATYTHTLEHTTHPTGSGTLARTPRYNIAFIIFCTLNIPARTHAYSPVNAQAYSMFDFNKDCGEHGNIFLLHICSREIKKKSQSTCRYFSPSNGSPVCFTDSRPLVCFTFALKNGAKSNAVLAHLFYKRLYNYYHFITHNTGAGWVDLHIHDH